MLSGAELAEMRDEAELALPDTCAIQTLTLTADGQGGNSEVYATSATVACRVSPAGRAMQEVPRADGTRAVADWIVTLPYGTSVDQTDRIVSQGTTYEVIGVKAPRGWELTCRVMARTTIV